MGELRKVQRTQTGTFFVSLPHSWACRCGLQKGFVVSIMESGDGKLLLDAKHDAEPSLSTVVSRPGPYLSREIIGDYLLGFDVIRVEAKENISFEIREIVKKAVSNLIGLEIIEEDFSSITLQCLLELSGFPPEKIMRRGYAIAAGMHRDVINAFITGDLTIAKNVIARDDESNRLYFLLVRILRTLVQNSSLSQKLGVSPRECLDYRLAGSLVEAIGDECVRIAQMTVELEGKKLDKTLCKLFLKFQATCFESHENAVRAFFSSDITLAEKVRSMHEEIEKRYSEIEESARVQSLDIVPQILSIATFLRRIYGHSVDIADLAVPRANH
jgi:phosphate uptake regulator